MNEPTSPTPRNRWWTQSWFLGLLLALVTFIAYQPAWRGDPVYDDDDHLTPPELQSVNGLLQIWTKLGVVSQYYPVAHSAFWLEHRLWGDSMLGYHLANILLHILSALLLFRILKQLELPGAWLAAALFALHPVQVESVAWISELKNTLSTAFYLVAALAYLKFDDSRQRKFYLAAFVLFGLGLLSKTVTASLPAALLIVFWWKRGKLEWKRDVPPLIPFFLAGIVSGLLTAWVERRFIGAHGEAFELSLIQRCLIAGRVVWFYLGNLIWPANLTFIYPRWNVSAAAWWQYLFPVTALLFVAGLWALRGKRRGPLAALLFFAGTLFPVMGFLNVYPFRYSFVADHYQYLANLGAITFAAAAIALLMERWKFWGRPAGNAFCLALLFALAALTWRQSRMYTGVETLWQTTLARNPNCFVAQSNLGNYYFQTGRIDDAILHCQKALALEPGVAEIHNNLGNAFLQQRRVAEATVQYEKAVTLRPDLAAAWFNLGVILQQQGQTTEAAARFQRAVELRPEFVKARNNLGNILLEQGRFDEAIVHFKKALEVRPDDADANSNLGVAFLQQGRFNDAIVCLQKALHLRPDDAKACSDLGNALLQKGLVDDAIVQYRKSLALQPNFDLAHYNFACALMQKGRTDEAIDHFRKTLELQPSLVQARYQLGSALSKKGRTDEAMAQFQSALELQPDFAEAHNDLGNILLQQGHAREALPHFRALLKLQPDNPSTLSVLAWTLSTWPDASLRNGIEAVELARRANQLTGGRNVMVLRALAAAYAEREQFSDATTAARQALKLANLQINVPLADALQSEIKLYQAGSPFRDSEPRN